ncbi:hypothetical protein PF010_g24274 [Phytophthora fragariae]|uniref:HTH araC/xylS-type domain-containing protein n=1 Tax=Phytophthora fragariae TaxID=53985 RepID=A0A6G0K3J9_9STRA|nr:hypothetical protein PF010_g24274 [Phytophthora fragariae]
MGAGEEKLSSIFNELEEQFHDSQEQVPEAFFMIAASLAALIHKNRQWLADTIGDDFYAVANGRPLELRSWSVRLIASYRKTLSREEKDSRSTLIAQVQDFIGKNLHQASLQSISASVYLNPSYLSKVYKMETGEGISEYMLRKPSYFIQLFKKHYGITPQEFRNKIGWDIP